MSDGGMSGVEEQGAADAPEAAIPPQNNGRKTIGRPFPKGVSGNPNGRPRIEPRVRRYARKYDRRMCRVLAGIAEDPKVTASERRRAAMDLVAIGSGRPAVTQEVLRPTQPLVALQVNQGGPMPSASGLDPVDATVLLATRGDTMPDGEREAIVASIFDRANRAAQRIAERRSLPPIEAAPSPIAEPEPAEKLPPAEATSASVESAAPAPPPLVLEGSTQPATPTTFDPAGLAAAGQMEAQRRREVAATEARQKNECRVEVENARARIAAAERDRRQREEEGQW